MCSICVCVRMCSICVCVCAYVQHMCVCVCVCAAYVCVCVRMCSICVCVRMCSICMCVCAYVLHMCVCYHDMIMRSECSSVNSHCLVVVVFEPTRTCMKDIVLNYLHCIGGMSTLEHSVPKVQ